MEQPVSTWARQRFGQRALHVRRGLVAALHVALSDAQNAQKESKSKHRFPFGSTLMTRRYECIVEAFEEMDGVEVVTPSGSAHSLVVLNGNLLLPFRYAKEDNVPIKDARVTDRKVSGLVAELFRCFGPAPSHEEPPLPLFDQAAEDPDLAVLKPVLTRLPADTRLVLIAYACNDRAGLLNAWWGEGELLDGAGHVRWLPDRYEQLPIARPFPPEEGHGRGSSGPVPGPRLVGSAGSVQESSFDDGVMPAVPLTARAPIERKNSDVFPPTSELIKETPVADDETR